MTRLFESCDFYFSIYKMTYDLVSSSCHPFISLICSLRGEEEVGVFFCFFQIISAVCKVAILSISIVSIRLMSILWREFLLETLRRSCLLRRLGVFCFFLFLQKIVIPTYLHIRIYMMHILKFLFFVTP